MTHYLALYGFVRRKDGLRVRVCGVDRLRCFLFHAGGETAAVVSLTGVRGFTSSPAHLVRHEEIVDKIFARQVFLPVKFPKLLGLRALRRGLGELDGEISRVLQKIVFKDEYHVRVYLAEYGTASSPSAHFNAFSRFIIENSSEYRYKHYFPILTQEAREAEFLNTAEQVVNRISRKLSNHAVYWRAKSFCSERIMLDAIFWVRRHMGNRFLGDIREMKHFYPNLKISVLGPRPPYNFVSIDLKNRV